MTTAIRPAIVGRDSGGKRVSLLNEEFAESAATHLQLQKTQTRNPSFFPGPYTRPSRRPSISNHRQSNNTLSSTRPSLDHRRCWPSQPAWPSPAFTRQAVSWPQAPRPRPALVSKSSIASYSSRNSLYSTHSSYYSSPSPTTPSLTRTHSFDSHSDGDPRSPTTPLAMSNEFSNPHPFQSQYPDPLDFETRNVFAAYPQAVEDKALSPPPHEAHLEHHELGHEHHEHHDQHELDQQQLAHQGQLDQLDQLDHQAQLEHQAAIDHQVQLEHQQQQQYMPEQQQQQLLQYPDPALPQQHDQQQQLSPNNASFDRQDASFDTTSYHSPVHDQQQQQQQQQLQAPVPIPPPIGATINPITGQKRYPCRYKDTHQCDKTFTTSGHASRHSKIHTAEKAVNCTFPGCGKKFTRADNMKQHLETHYKDRSRKSGLPKLTQPAGVKKSQGRVNIGRPENHGDPQQHAPMAPMDPYAVVSYPNDIYDYAAGYPSPKLETHDVNDLTQFQAYTQQQPPPLPQASSQNGQQPPGNQQTDPALHGRTSSDSCGLDALAAAAIGSGRQ